MERNAMEILQEVRQEIASLRSISEDALDILANVDQLLQDEAVATAVAAQAAREVTAALIPVIGETADR